MAIYAYDTAGGQEWVKQLPIYAAGANLLKGAFIKWGATNHQDTGFAIPCPVNTGLSAKFLGILAQPFAGATLDNDPTAGTKFLKADCLVGPNHVYRVKFDGGLTAGAFTNGLTMTTCASTSIVVASGENITGGWLYTDAGYLHYVLNASSGTYTLLSAVNSKETTANYALKLLYPGAPKVTLKATFEQLAGNTAAQGAVELGVIDLWLKAVGYDYVQLDPTKHDGLYAAPSTSEFWADVTSTQHAFRTNA